VANTTSQSTAAAVARIPRGTRTVSGPSPSPCSARAGNSGVSCGPRYELYGSERLRVFVAPAGGHDDYLMSLARYCQAATDAAVGQRRRARPPQGVPAATLRSTSGAHWAVVPADRVETARARICASPPHNGGAGGGFTRGTFGNVRVRRRPREYHSWPPNLYNRRGNPIETGGRRAEEECELRARAITATGHRRNRGPRPARCGRTFASPAPWTRRSGVPWRTRPPR
jgi:hypothetical protein